MPLLEAIEDSQNGFCRLGAIGPLRPNVEILLARQEVKPLKYLYN